MFKRTFSALMISLLCIGMIVFGFDVRPAKADAQTIYINADGSITPAGAPIATSDNTTYTFTGTIGYPTYDGIVVQRSDIVINGNGYTLQGNQSGNAIYGTNINNVTIKNTNVENFGFGIYLYNAPNSIISGNNITGNTFNGIRVGFASNYSISENNIADNLGGLWLGMDSNVDISGNVFTDDGLLMPYNTFGNSVENNTVNGRPLVYLEGVKNYSVGSAGQVILVRCDGITVENQNLSETVVGVELWQTDDTVISKNIMGNNSFASVYAIASSNNSISGNDITNSVDSCGVQFFDGASNNNISGNNLTNDYAGLFFSNQYNTNNSISGNNIVNNYYGILLDFPSSGNMIYHNNFINNTFAVLCDNQTGATIEVWDDGYPSGGNYYSDYRGIDLFSGPYQNITGSDGIGDTPYVFNANNTDNYPLMGRFSTLYSNVTSASIPCISNSTVSGFQLNITTMSFDVSGEPGTTGFCRVSVPHSTLFPPYTIEIDGIPVSYTTVYEDTTESVIYFTYGHSRHEVTITGTFVHDVAVTNVTSPKTVVFQGYSFNVTVTAADLGSYPETFNATVYANTTFVASQNITLTSEGSENFTFTCYATGLALGNYTISAYAWPVSGETNTANNNFTDGFVYVSMVGDLNCDGKCDGRDITVVAKCFGSKLGDSRYNPNCDILNRGRIDGRDITIVAKNFGKHDP